MRGAVPPVTLYTCSWRGA